MQVNKSLCKVVEKELAPAIFSSKSTRILGLFQQNCVGFVNGYWLHLVQILIWSILAISKHKKMCFHARCPWSQRLVRKKTCHLTHRSDTFSPFYLLINSFFCQTDAIHESIFFEIINTFTTQPYSILGGWLALFTSQRRPSRSVTVFFKYFLPNFL